MKIWLYKKLCYVTKIYLIHENDSWYKGAKLADKVEGGQTQASNGEFQVICEIEIRHLSSNVGWIGFEINSFFRIFFSPFGCFHDGCWSGVDRHAWRFGRSLDMPFSTLHCDNQNNNITGENNDKNNQKWNWSENDKSVGGHQKIGGHW